MIRFGELNTFTTCGSKLSRLSTLNSGIERRRVPGIDQFLGEAEPRLAAELLAHVGRLAEIAVIISTLEMLVPHHRMVDVIRRHRA